MSRSPSFAISLATSKPALLVGKIIVDANNRDYSVEARTGAWFKESIAERLQNAASDAQVVKAFNTIAMGSFDTSPHVLSEAAAQTFIAGRDAAAKATVTTIAAELGFETIDVGGSVAALRATEALGDVIRLLMIDGGRGVRGAIHPVRQSHRKGEPLSNLRRLRPGAGETTQLHLEALYARRILRSGRRFPLASRCKLRALHHRVELPWETVLTATIDNLTNEDPPYVRLELGYDPFTASGLGRTYELGINRKF